MKKELLKQQIKPLLLFGLPAWGLTFFAVLSRSFSILIVVIPIYIFLIVVNSHRFCFLFEKKYPNKHNRQFYPHYVEGEGEINKYFSIDVRWKIIILGIVLTAFVTSFLFCE